MRRRAVAVEGGREVSCSPPLGLRSAASPRQGWEPILRDPPVLSARAPAARKRGPTDQLETRSHLLEKYWRRSSTQLRCSGHAGASSIRLQHGLQCPGQAGEVAVVDTTVAQLARELAE